MRGKKTSDQVRRRRRERKAKVALQFQFFCDLAALDLKQCSPAELLRLSEQTLELWTGVITVGVVGGGSTPKVARAEWLRIQKMVGNLLNYKLRGEGGIFAPVSLTFIVNPHFGLVAQGATVRDTLLALLVLLLREPEAERLRECVRCGKKFFKTGKQIYCGSRCAQTAAQAAWRAREEKKKKRKETRS